MQVVKANSIEEGKPGWLIYCSDKEIWTLTKLSGNVLGGGVMRAWCTDLYTTLSAATKGLTFHKNPPLPWLSPAETDPDWVWEDGEDN